MNHKAKLDRCVGDAAQAMVDAGAPGTMTVAQVRIAVEFGWNAAIETAAQSVQSRLTCTSNEDMRRTRILSEHVLTLKA